MGVGPDAADCGDGSRSGLRGRPRSDEAIGGTYDLCGPERLTFARFSRPSDGDGPPGALGPISFPIARFQATFPQTVCGFMHPAPPLNREQLLMFRDNIGDGSRADAVFELRLMQFRDAAANSYPPMRKPSLLIIFLTVFIDLVGFGMVLPLLPKYVKDFGAPDGCSASSSPRTP
jgi:hypothetical protein